MDIPPTTSRIAEGAVPAASDAASPQPGSPAALCEPAIVGARLRRGVKLPNGRPVGETDRVVHLMLVAATETMPEHLTALCGLEIRPDEAEQVSVKTGMPCVPCLNAVPRPADAAVFSAADPR